MLGFVTLVIFSTVFRSYFTDNTLASVLTAEWYLAQYTMRHDAAHSQCLTRTATKGKPNTGQGSEYPVPGGLDAKPLLRNHYARLGHFLKP